MNYYELVQPEYQVKYLARLLTAVRLELIKKRQNEEVDDCLLKTISGARGKEIYLAGIISINRL